MTSGTQTNRHGLSRTIPAEVKRVIRQECGFGCVVCGIALCQYEHINPEFHDAPTHDPAKMALLCAGCHDAVTRQRRSKASIIAARAAPKCLQQGYAREFLASDLKGEVAINIGLLATVGCGRILRILGEDVVWVDPPELDGGPARLNAVFLDPKGIPLCEIVENELRVRKSNWDVEVVGPRLTIRNGKGDIALCLRTEAGRSIQVERLQMRYRGVTVAVTTDPDAGIEFGTSRLIRHRLSFGIFESVPSCVEVFQDFLVVGGRMKLMPDGSSAAIKPTANLGE